MKLFTIAAILILAALPLLAQTSTTEVNQDTPHFSTSASYAQIIAGAKPGQSTSVSVFDISLPVSPRWSLGAKILQFGPDGRALLGGAKIAEKGCHIFKSKSALVDLCKVQFTLEFGAGVKQDAGISQFAINSAGNTPAFGIGTCTTVDAGTLFSGQLKMGACLGGLFMPWNKTGSTRIGLGSALNVSPLLQWSK